jgi:CspA family cold shock protein
VEDTFPLEEEGIEVKLIGTVKWFSRKKGYGFITKADGTDLFFHRADISRKEHVWPEDGQQVEFQIRRTDKGPEAFNVSLLPSD